MRSLRILIFVPVFPKLNKGAAEQDQIFGALHLKQLGHTVRLAAFLPGYQSPAEVQAYGEQIGLDVTAFPYPTSTPRFHRLALAVRLPALADGAAAQHAHPALLAFAQEQIDTFKPDLLWLETTFLWPVAALTRHTHTRVVIRSHNFEPDHVLDESGRTLFNYIRSSAKKAGETTALRHSDLLAAITPVEQTKYQQLSSRADNVELLPLRGLPSHLRPPRPATPHKPLQVFYWGSTYNVSHNRAALELVVQQIWPRVRQAAPGEFALNIFGGKVPAYIQSQATGDLIIHGFVPDLEAELDQMDIALVPSLYGCGMQQKIFEPLCRGFPEVTSARGLAGYAFEPGVDVLTADTPADFATHLLSLRDPARRATLAANGNRRAAELFSEHQQIQAYARILNLAAGKIN